MRGSGSLTGKRGQATEAAERRRRRPIAAELVRRPSVRRSKPVAQCMHSGRPACIVGDSGSTLPASNSSIFGGIFLFLLLFLFIATFASYGNVYDGGTIKGSALVLEPTSAPGLGARGPTRNTRLWSS